jgi:S-sulfosulfanyl-L-cysteine sulfohydrolase
VHLLAAVAGGVPAAGRAAGDIYNIGRFGHARVLHITDTHAQLLPVFYREPSVNIGVGAMRGEAPHLVGKAFLDHYGIAPGSRAAHAFTFLDFTAGARRYGRIGGFAHLKTLVDRLRGDAGPGASILVDGGDMWQGSGLADASRGADMVEAANLLGVEAMTGHWEFTYGEDALRDNIGRFNGAFLAQNVFLSAEASFNDAPADDPASGRVFKPALVKELGGYRIAIVGQAFPYVPIAHPKRFVSNWTFGIHEEELQKLVDHLRADEHVDAVLLLSHNGMDADLKLASRVTGIDVILGGHTHDAVPQPTIVGNRSGKTVVTNAGSNGKFLGVLDLDLRKGSVADLHYRLLPVFPDLLPPNRDMATLIERLRVPHAGDYGEKLASADALLYRRGNFNGPLDQLICDALRRTFDAQIALSPGLRWGTSVLPGEPITMEDVLAATAMTYPQAYVQTMSGAEIKAVMEDVCDNLFNPDPYAQQGGDMVRLGGIDYACAPGAPAGQRISDLRLDDGRPLDAGKTYRVAGWASVTPRDGRAVADILADYLRSEKTVRAKRPNRVMLKGVAGNPGIAEG